MELVVLLSTWRKRGTILLMTCSRITCIFNVMLCRCVVAMIVVVVFVVILKIAS